MTNLGIWFLILVLLAVFTSSILTVLFSSVVVNVVVGSIVGGLWGFYGHGLVRRWRER